MGFTKITAEDTANKGVVGLADTPNLSTQEMQEKFEELSTDVIIPKFNELSDELDDMNLDKRVSSEEITNIRLNKDNQLETSKDGGETYEATASSGHIIENGAGTMFPSRSRMQFSDNVTVIDNPMDNKTFVSIPAGEKGDKGESATITIGNVESGDEAQVENVGSDTDAIFNFIFPRGEHGSAATIRVGSVQSGENASVFNSGTTSDAVFNFVLPKGEKGDTGTSFQIKGMYATYEELIAAHPTGSRGDAYAVGTSEENVIYNWNNDTRAWDNLGGLKGVKGDTGESATITVGTITKGETTNVENVGTSEHAIFNFTLEQGAKGEKGDSATISIGTVEQGDYPEVTNVGTPQNAIFNFKLQKGEKGEQGTPTTVNGKSAANIEIDTRDIRMIGYKKEAEGEITTEDTLMTAISKLETRKSGGSIINVTVPSDYIGKTVIVENGDERYEQVANLVVVSFNVENGGTWTITCDDIVDTLEITFYGVYNISLDSYNYKKWLAEAEITQTYDSLEEVLADEKTVRTLMTKHASSDYLIKWCEAKLDDARTILSNGIVAKWINLRDYILDKVLGSEILKDLVAEIDKYGYGEIVPVFKNLVPIMTSATTPSGQVFGTTADMSNYPPYKAFDGSTSTLANFRKTDGTQYIGYKFTEKTIVDTVSITNYTYNHVLRFAIERSNDGTSWDFVGEYDNSNQTSYGVSTYALEKKEPYLYYRLRPIRITDNEYGNVAELQFGVTSYEPKGCIPVMTSNNSPYGECFASSVLSQSGTTYYTYKCMGANAFKEPADPSACAGGVGQWIGYKFTNPIKISRVKFQFTNGGTAKVQISNDGTNYTDIGTVSGAQYGIDEINVETDTYALYVRFICTAITGTNYGSRGLQVYGRSLNVSVPTMTSNNAPWGEVIRSSIYNTSYDGWKAFDGDDTSNTSVWASTSGANQWLGFDFGKAVKIGFVYLHNYVGFTCKFQYSADGVEWFDESDRTYTRGENNKLYTTINADDSYRYWRMYVTNSSGTNNVYTLQFYGIDYNEHEERHYVYDHGLKLNDAEVVNVTPNMVSVAEEQNQIVFTKNNVTGGTSNALLSGKKGNYSLARVKIGNKAYNGVTSAAWLLQISCWKTLNTTDYTNQRKGFVLTHQGITEIGWDISSYDSTDYICTGVTQVNSDAGMQSSITEFWLE